MRLPFFIHELFLATHSRAQSESKQTGDHQCQGARLGDIDDLGFGHGMRQTRLTGGTGV